MRGRSRRVPGNGLEHEEVHDEAQEAEPALVVRGAADRARDGDECHDEEQCREVRRVDSRETQDEESPHRARRTAAEPIEVRVRDHEAAQQEEQIDAEVPRADQRAENRKRRQQGREQQLDVQQHHPSGRDASDAGEWIDVAAHDALSPELSCCRILPRGRPRSKS